MRMQSQPTLLTRGQHTNIVARVRAVPCSGVGGGARTGQGPSGSLLMCVANVSEGRDPSVVGRLAETCGECLLDVHSDAHHNRCVLTLAGQPDVLLAAVRELASATVDLLDLASHSGVHPTFGVLDVVPWVALEGWPLHDAEESAPSAGAARSVRDAFAAWAARELRLPVFLYGPERALPDVRRWAWKQVGPDLGPPAPHPTAGSVAVGSRPLMVAYNMWMAEEVGPHQAKAIASALRSPEVRALAFPVGTSYQVSCNLVRPLQKGPAEVWDEVARFAPITRGEVVGLVPWAVLEATPEGRWAEVGLSPDLTIEARLSATGPSTT